MKTLIKLFILLLIIYGVYQGYGLIRNEIEPVKKMEYRLTTTPISEIVLNPSKFDDEIAVSGRVSQSINILGIRCFKLVDPDNPENKLLIMPKKSSVPKEGTLIRVKGNVKQLFKVGDIELVAVEATE